MFIYKYTNPNNNKVYIGKWTSSLVRLHSRYVREINTPNCKRSIVNVLRKYGIENIKFEIIKESDNKDDLKQLEKHFIQLFDTYKNGYNETIGGDGGNGSKLKGRKMSLEARQKMSAAKKGKPAHNKGTKASLETRHKLSIAKLGKKRFVSDEERESLKNRIITYNKSERGRQQSKINMIKLNKEARHV